MLTDSSKLAVTGKRSADSLATLPAQLNQFF